MPTILKSIGAGNVLLMLLAMAAGAAELPKHPERMGLNEAVSAYIAVAEDEDQTALVRNYAAAQIIRRGNDALPHLKTLYRGAGVSKRGILADILVGITTDDEKVRTLLLNDLRSTGTRIDPRVIRALGIMGVQDAVPELLRVLPMVRDETRLAALCALGRLADERAIEPLAAGLDDRDRLVRSHCAEGVIKVLEKMHAEEDVSKRRTYRDLLDRTLAYARNGRHEDVRRMLITGAGRVGDEQAAPTLRRLLTREPDAIRAAAAGALGALRDRRSADDLVDLAGEDNTYVRRAAIRALGEIGEQASVPPLVLMLETCEASWRREIVAALRKITGEPYGANPAQWRHWWEKER
jgi:HEAT repeat protein